VAMSRPSLEPDTLDTLAHPTPWNLIIKFEKGKPMLNAN
jgi:hypothetical protein